MPLSDCSHIIVMERCFLFGLWIALLLLFASGFTSKRHHEPKRWAVPPPFPSFRFTQQGRGETVRWGPNPIARPAPRALPVAAKGNGSGGAVAEQRP